MLEKIVQLDKQVLVYLNGLGSEQWDGLWLIITKQVYWAPVFLLVFYVLQQKIGWKKFGYYVLFIAVLILICDQTVNLFKYGFERLRPCNDPDINDVIRLVKTSKSFSFFSGHATNSMATTVLTFLILKRYYKHAYLLFLFPLIFAYSRIYLGLHFPSDILTGYCFGGTMGLVAYQVYQKYILKN
ncbi:phosphatase PAP2 family protein [Flavobacterium sedimenticola]|uniref:Phosphatase PAP2 family protein n=1 Tax=Flavobacterium sedimenticola TaxID=3043286 RepID=A0ABT6XSJ1_9FLAO|nr:phosphatase PAP2 family protein [Flavobacterium sedimenticola]MDI9257792.1 phosphatase PAP2 family protein [Flavobacterium sedimenticola]